MPTQGIYVFGKKRVRKKFLSAPSLFFLSSPFLSFCAPNHPAALSPDAAAAAPNVSIQTERQTAQANYFKVRLCHSQNRRKRTEGREGIEGRVPKEGRRRRDPLVLNGATVSCDFCEPRPTTEDALVVSMDEGGGRK